MSSPLPPNPIAGTTPESHVAASLARVESSRSSDPPHWASDYPIRHSGEHKISRRQFTKAACCSVLAVGSGWMGRNKILPLPAGTQNHFVAKVEDVPIGGSRLFRYPTEDHPAILVRLGEAEFVAYSQACTHLMCPVNYQHEKRQFYCPCHEGFFSAEDGRVIAGPPPRPLPRYPVEVRKGEIWIVPKQQVANSDEQ